MATRAVDENGHQRIGAQHLNSAVAVLARGIMDSFVPAASNFKHDVYPGSCLQTYVARSYVARDNCEGYNVVKCPCTSIDA